MFCFLTKSLNAFKQHKNHEQVGGGGAPPYIHINILCQEMHTLIIINRHTPNEHSHCMAPTYILTSNLNIPPSKTGTLPNAHSHCMAPTYILTNILKYTLHKQYSLRTWRQTVITAGLRDAIHKSEKIALGLPSIKIGN